MRRFIFPLALGLFFLSLLSTQPRRAPWYEQWTLNFFSPLTSLFSGASNVAHSIWGRYFFLVGKAKEAEGLQKELEKFRQQQATFQELREENNRLHTLLHLKQKFFPEAVAAQVIALDPSAEYFSLRIDKGSNDGVEPDMPVVARQGLVGKIGPVFKKEATVLLITDPASSVDVLNSRSRIRALLTGSGSKSKASLRPRFLTRLEYLRNTSDIHSSDWVVTSGLDGLFPKGILVGEVSRIDKSRYGIFVNAKVVPFVDFSRLEEVLVLKRGE